MSKITRIIIIFAITLALFALATELLHYYFGPELLGFQVIEFKTNLKIIQKTGLIKFVLDLVRSEVDYPLSPFLTFYGILSIIFLLSLISLRFFIKDTSTKKIFSTYLVMSTLLFFLRLSQALPSSHVPVNVFNGTAETPYLYRVLVPFLSYLLKTIIPSLTWRNSAGIWNYIFALSLFPLFHIYLRKWFDQKIAFLINIIFCCLLPLSFDYDYPEDFLELSLFIIGYMLIRDKKDIFLGPLIFFATFSRETAVFLAIAYFISRINKKDLLKTITKSSAFFICWLIPFAGIRLIRGPTLRPDFFMGVRNLEYIIFDFFSVNSNFFSSLFFLGVFFSIYLMFDKKDEDNFLKRNTITITVAFLAAFWFANINEPRIFYPILPILVPLAFYPLLAGHDTKTGILQ
ncbi:MAG: hypothetical protein JW867_06100 [Candidatus Omnitrophica bacterium]|nr:hypothetical protein [Candidatus Omnitrophota bacterium]